ncbi:hypothetical protein Ancab_028625 [Ancistrocladus abbreviatus]
MLRGSQKSKRVSWASDGNLCQVRLFLSEDSPSQVGLDAQEHLQAKKTTHVLHSTGSVPDDSSPPGFEGFNPANQLKQKLAEIPVIKWICPPRFILNATWLVVAGEESREVEIQSQRELRVLEAIYPRPSAIPPNPVFLDAENSVNDDQLTPLIPITPIEEEDAAGDLPCGSAPPPSASICSHVPLLAHGAPSSLLDTSSYTPHPLDNGKLVAQNAVIGQADVTFAASAALTALLKSNEPSSFVDHELLVKILGNPKILEGLVKLQAAPSSSQNTPSSFEGSQAAPQPLSSAPLMCDSPLHSSKSETGPSASAVTSNGPFYHPNGMPHGVHLNPTPPVAGVAQVPPPSNGMPHGFHLNPTPPVAGVAQVPPPSYPVSSPPAKDINYYKSLVQQHGGEKQVQTIPPFIGHHNQRTEVSPDSAENFKPRDCKPKIMKPCIYFNSPKGCRHGANCAYQHDASLQQQASSILEMQSAKRMKTDREIRGSQLHG